MTESTEIKKPNIFRRAGIKLAQGRANQKKKRTQKKLENMSNNELANYSNKITQNLAQNNKTKKQKEKSKSSSPPSVPPLAPQLAPPSVPPDQENQNNIEKEFINSEDNIKPLGSPGMYGMIVLGLFGFASYLQFSAFKDKQTFGN